MDSSKTPRLPRKDFENEIVIKAWKDPQFAEELRKNPHATLQREMDRIRPGSRIPNTMKIQILEETQDTMYIVLPPKPAAIAADSGELTDAELEQVAGGGPTCANCGTNTCGTCLHASCSYSGILLF